MLLRLFIVFFVLASAFPVCAEQGKAISIPVHVAADTAAAEIADVTIAIDATNICTVSDTVVYSRGIYIGDANNHSVAMVIDTTSTQSAVIECQELLIGLGPDQIANTDDDTETWQSVDPAATITITDDYSKTWYLPIFVSKQIRFKFNLDTVGPEHAYEIEQFRVRKK